MAEAASRRPLIGEVMRVREALVELLNVRRKMKAA
jgi:hypothetical protein